MNNDEERYGSMNHLTKEQAYWEDLVYGCKELPVILLAIGLITEIVIFVLIVK